MSDTKTIYYDYQGISLSIVGIVLAGAQIVGIYEDFSYYRVWFVLAFGVLAGFGMARYRVPIVKLEENGLVLVSRNSSVVLYRDIVNCTFSWYTGMELQLKDGSRIKSAFGMPKSKVEIQSLIRDINSKLSEPKNSNSTDAKKLHS